MVRSLMRINSNRASAPKTWKARVPLVVVFVDRIQFAKAGSKPCAFYWIFRP